MAQLPERDFTWSASVPKHTRQATINKYGAVAPHISDCYILYTTLEGKQACANWAELSTCYNPDCNRPHIDISQLLKKVRISKDEQKLVKSRRQAAIAENDGHLLPDDVIPTIPTANQGTLVAANKGVATGVNTMPLGGHQNNTGTTSTPVQQPEHEAQTLHLGSTAIPGMKRSKFVAGTCGDEVQFDAHQGALICPLSACGNAAGDIPLQRCTITLPTTVARQPHSVDASQLENQELLFTHTVAVVPRAYCDTINSSFSKMKGEEFAKMSAELARATAGRAAHWATTAADLNQPVHRTSEDAAFRSEFDAFKHETRTANRKLEGSIERIEENQGKTTSILDKMLDRLSLPHFGGSAENAIANKPTLPAIANGMTQTSAFPGMAPSSHTTAVDVDMTEGAAPAGASSAAPPKHTSVANPLAKGTAAIPPTDTTITTGRTGAPASNTGREKKTSRGRKENITGAFPKAAGAPSKRQSLLWVPKSTVRSISRARSKSRLGRPSPARGAIRTASKVRPSEMADATKYATAGMRKIYGELEKQVPDFKGGAGDSVGTLQEIDAVLVAATAYTPQDSAKAVSTRGKALVVDLVAHGATWDDIGDGAAELGARMVRDLTHETLENLLLRLLDVANLSKNSVIVQRPDGKNSIKDIKTARQLVLCMHCLHLQNQDRDDRGPPTQNKDGPAAQNPFSGPQGGLDFSFMDASRQSISDISAHDDSDGPDRYE